MLSTRITNYGIHNFLDKNLDPELIKVLGMGLKFIPTPRSPKPNLKLEWHRVIRNIRLKEFFLGQDQDQCYNQFKVQNPDFDPPNLKNMFLDNLLSYTISNHNCSNNYDFSKVGTKRTKYNVSKNAYYELSRISTDLDIIIKPADKNLGITLLKTSWYIEEVFKHLKNTMNYEELTKEQILKKCYDLKQVYITVMNQISFQNHNVTNKEERRNIKNWIQFLCKFTNSQEKNYLWTIQFHSLEQVFDYLNKTTCTFYILPKVHKPTLSSRPIVSAHSFILTPLSVYFAHLLNPVMKSKHTYLKDSKDLVSMLDKLKLNSTTTNNNNEEERTWIITGDVESLYPNIDIELALKWFKKYWIDLIDKNEYRYLNKSMLINLFELLLKNSYTNFMNQYYVQIQGIPMGTPSAPQIANLYLSSFDNTVRIKQLETTSKILIFKRFIDDLFIIVYGKRIDIEFFCNNYNSIHPKIRVNWNIQQIKNEFLDLIIEIRDGRIITSTHQKSMNNYLYIPYKSFHPRHVKTNFIINELKRYRRNSTLETDFEITKELFYYRLINRGYPYYFLNKLFKMVVFKDRFLDFKMKQQLKNNNNHNNNNNNNNNNTTTTTTTQELELELLFTDRQIEMFEHYNNNLVLSLLQNTKDNNNNNNNGNGEGNSNGNSSNNSNGSEITITTTKDKTQEFFMIVPFHPQTLDYKPSNILKFNNWKMYKSNGPCLPQIRTAWRMPSSLYKILIRAKFNKFNLDSTYTTEQARYQVI